MVGASIRTTRTRRRQILIRKVISTRVIIRGLNIRTLITLSRTVTNTIIREIPRRMRRSRRRTRTII